MATPSERLGSYLNDHLGGAVAALELLEHLIGSDRAEPPARALSALREEIEEDKAILEDLIHRVGATESGARKAAGWLAEKAARLKLGRHRSGGDELELLEALEALSLGVEGKRSLWRGLSPLPVFRGIDFERLQARATGQRNVLEIERLAAAHRAFDGARSERT